MILCCMRSDSEGVASAIAAGKMFPGSRRVARRPDAEGGVVQFREFWGAKSVEEENS